MTGLALMVLVLMVVMAAVGMPAVSVLELKATRKDVVAKMKALAEKGTLSDEEEKQFQALTTEGKDLKAKIERLETVAAEAADLAVTDPVPSRPAPDATVKAKKGVIANPGFRDAGEIVHTYLTNPGDSRIGALRAEMKTSEGVKGGLLIPTDLDPMVRSVSPQEAVVRPRARIIPAGDAPDAEYTEVYLNQKAGKGMYGGVTVSWLGAEDANVPDSDATLREVTFKAKPIAGAIIVSKMALANAPAIQNVIDVQLRGAHVAAEDQELWTGAGGAGRPLGVLKGAGVLKVNRATADKFKYADARAMLAKRLRGHDQNFMWVWNPAVTDEVRGMVDDPAGNAPRLIWQQDAIGGTPSTFLGLPWMENHRSAALGDLGDVALVNIREGYAVKEGSPTIIEVSEHLYIRTRRVLIQAYRSVDGAPTFDGAFRQEDGIDYSLSVVLDVPA